MYTRSNKIIGEGYIEISTTNIGKKYLLGQKVMETVHSSRGDRIPLSALNWNMPFLKSLLVTLISTVHSTLRLEVLCKTRSCYTKNKFIKIIIGNIKFSLYYHTHLIGLCTNSNDWKW